MILRFYCLFLRPWLVRPLLTYMICLLLMSLIADWDPLKGPCLWFPNLDLLPKVTGPLFFGAPSFGSPCLDLSGMQTHCHLLNLSLKITFIMWLFLLQRDCCNLFLFVFYPMGSCLLIKIVFYYFLFIYFDICFYFMRSLEQQSTNTNIYGKQQTLLLVSTC